MRKMITEKDAVRVAIAYGRYSSNNQREESIDAQFRAIDEYAEKNDIKIVEYFSDEAQTGKNDNRDDFQNMITQILKGYIQCDAILVHKFNRFARNKYDSALYKKKLKDIGVKVISVTQKIDDTPEGQMMESFIEAMDEYYSANLALEVRKGLRENALKGKHNGGKRLLGLSVDKEGYYYPNDEAWIVRRIFEEYTAGIPKTEICRRLNEEGITNQYGRTFNPRHIYDMLRNEKYIGNYLYTITAKETVRLDGIIKDPIIDYDLWKKAEKVREMPVKQKFRERKRFYHLTGKTFCAECGMPISGAGAKKQKNGTSVAYYKCVGKAKHKNGCTNTSLNKEWFEANVLKTVVKNVFNEEMIEKISASAFAELEAERDKPKNTTEALKKKIAQIHTKQARLMDLYLDGEMNKEMLDKKNEQLRETKNALENEIEKNKALAKANAITQKTISDFIKNYITNLNDLKNISDDDFARAVFTTVVEKVVVSRTGVEVYISVNLSDLVGAMVNIGGAIRTLSPINLNYAFDRKKNLYGRNE